MNVDESLRLARQHHRSGRLEQAEALYRQVLALQPDHLQALNDLGVALAAHQQWEQALEFFRKVVQLQPEAAQSQLNLGGALAELGRLDQAVPCFRKALALRPDFAQAHYNLGKAMHDLRDMDQAIACFERALALQPHFADALNSLGNSCKDTGRLHRARDCYRKAQAVQPQHLAAASNLVYLLHCDPDSDSRAIYHEHQLWNQRHAQPLARFIRPHDNDRSPERRLRIGYLSADFREHVVGWNLLPLLSHHDHAQFEIYCYADVARPDQMTRRLAACTDVWRSIHGIDDERAAEMIRADRIDILVDLSLHTAGNRLLIFARKPAPVQVTYLGYCSTTGLETIDYRFSDPHMDPPDTDLSCYSEQTVRLPSTFWCYQPAGPTPDVSPPPALSNGFVTFGCLNNFAKVSTATIELWVQLMRELPTARLILNCPPGSHRQELCGQFASGGVSGERLEFVAPQPWPIYIQTYQRIDLSLDPFPQGGGITTCDSLWMGVAVVSLWGRTAVGRGGRSILSNIGMPELVANTPQQYVRNAADWKKWIDLRPTLRQKMLASPLMDAARFARDVEAAYRRTWSNWAGQPPTLANESSPQSNQGLPG